jgi:methylglyoxal synthase
MLYRKIAMEHDKKIALVAHDNKKRDLVEWAKYNRDLLAHHDVFATGTTGEILEQQLGFKITKLQSGPLGGDQQIGARITENKIDFLIFFWDPLEPMPHDPDVKALLRMAVVWNIPIACNRASADFMISSPLMDGEYDRLVPDYEGYRSRKIIVGEGMDQEAEDAGEEMENAGDPGEGTEQDAGNSGEGAEQVAEDPGEGEEGNGE